MANKEISELKQILGLQQGKDYTEASALKTLRYGHLMIMTDQVLLPLPSRCLYGSLWLPLGAHAPPPMPSQDHDGSHIKGLIINFLHCYWPALLHKHDFVREFVTPIVKVTKGPSSQSFFTLQEYHDWSAAQVVLPPHDTPPTTRLHATPRHAPPSSPLTPALPSPATAQANANSWKIKYYKGLGTSTSQEAKQYFSDLDKHELTFTWSGATDGDKIVLAFSKTMADQRKEWLRGYDPDAHVDHSGASLDYTTFIDKELIHFSNADNVRSIPSMLDGLKPGQRKILFSCFKRGKSMTKNEIKVAQLAGYVSEHSAYHHGEASLAGTIVGMAQTFVGSNNVALLYPAGQVIIPPPLPSTPAHCLNPPPSSSSPRLTLSPET